MNREIKDFSANKRLIIRMFREKGYDKQMIMKDGCIKEGRLITLIRTCKGYPMSGNKCRGKRIKVQEIAGCKETKTTKVPKRLERCVSGALFS